MLYSQCVGCRFSSQSGSTDNPIRNKTLEYDVLNYDALNCHYDIDLWLNRFVYGFDIHSTSTTVEELLHILIPISRWQAARILYGNNTHWLCFNDVFPCIFGVCDVPNFCWRLLCFVLTPPNSGRYIVAGVPTWSLRWWFNNEGFSQYAEY